MASHIGRRKFLATLGSAVAAWPLAARATATGEAAAIGFLGATTAWAQKGNGATLPKRLLRGLIVPSRIGLLAP